MNWQLDQTKKTQRSPAGDRTRVFRLPVGRSKMSVHICRIEKERSLMSWNGPDRNEFSICRLILIRFLTGYPYSKIKNLVTLVESQQKKLFLRAYGNQIEWHNSRCHGDSIAQLKVMEARKRVQIKKCYQDAIKRNKKPKFPQQTTFQTLFTEKAQKRPVLVVFCMKTKNMRQLWTLLW